MSHQQMKASKVTALSSQTKKNGKAPTSKKVKITVLSSAILSNQTFFVTSNQTRQRDKTKVEFIYAFIYLYRNLVLYQYFLCIFFEFSI